LADLYATAAGLVERSAAAFASGVPEDASDDGCGAAQPPYLAPGRRTEIRQSLGVLDALFLSEPGVLEARQWITLRMRAGRAA
jgi:hypothetical protein